MLFHLGSIFQKVEFPILISQCLDFKPQVTIFLSEQLIFIEYQLILPISCGRVAEFHVQLLLQIHVLSAEFSDLCPKSFEITTMDLLH